MEDITPDEESSVLERRYGRRAMLKASGVGAAATTLGGIGALAAPARMALGQTATATTTRSDIQHDIGALVDPPTTVDGIQFGFPPVFTTFSTLKFTRNPTKADQTTLENAFKAIEANYPASPAGVFVMTAYGIPYFNRLPGGINGALVRSRMPRLRSNTNRNMLEEAVPAPTDVVAGNGITKLRFNVPVKIEGNDMVLILRSDSQKVLDNVIDWLNARTNFLNGHFVPAPNLSFLTLTSRRLMFVDLGLPRKVADANNLPFAFMIDPRSPMWMGFADQHVNGAGPALITTAQGNASARLTTAVAGNYFDKASIMHLAHTIQDLEQFYTDPDDENVHDPFRERVRYMFRANPAPAEQNADPFTDGGGPGFLPNLFRGPGDAANDAQGIGNPEGQHRIGHLTALQRSSRATDGTPIHARMDGPGFDSMDVPSGKDTAKLEFAVFIPTAEFFRVMRRNVAAQDLQTQFDVPEEDNGLERFITATRRQNYLMPPRRHRSLPLIELT